MKLYEEWLIKAERDLESAKKFWNTLLSMRLVHLTHKKHNNSFWSRLSDIYPEYKKG